MRVLWSAGSCVPMRRGKDTNDAGDHGRGGRQLNENSNQAHEESLQNIQMIIECVTANDIIIITNLNKTFFSSITSRVSSRSMPTVHCSSFGLQHLPVNNSMSRTLIQRCAIAIGTRRNVPHRCWHPLQSRPIYWLVTLWLVALSSGRNPPLGEGW